MSFVRWFLPVYLWWQQQPLWLKQWDDVISKLEMQGCKLVYTSPNRSNIYYEVRPRTDIETDFAPLVSDLQCNYNKAERVIVYCRSYNMCADLYEHFLFSLGDSCYYYILLFYSTILLVSSYEINLNIPHLNMIFTSNIHGWTWLLQVDNNIAVKHTAIYGEVLRSSGLL